jgi:hypothetical protein
MTLSSLPLAEARGGVSNPSAVGSIRPRDLHASGLITHLLHCDIDIV